jgi:hypothetical protein
MIKRISKDELDKFLVLSEYINVKKLNELELGPSEEEDFIDISDVYTSPKDKQ